MANLYARNLVTNPRGRRTSGTVTIRENRIPNPVPNGTAHWSDSLVNLENLGDGWTRGTTTGDGTTYIQTVPFDHATVPVTGLDMAEVSMDVRVPSGGSLVYLELRVFQYDSSGELGVDYRHILHPRVPLQPGEETRLSGTFQPEVRDGGVGARVLLYIRDEEQNYSQGNVLDFRHVYVGEPGDYFDGDTWDGDPDFTPEWTGTPGESTSRLVAPAPVGWVRYGLAYYSETWDAIALRATTDEPQPYVIRSDLPPLESHTSLLRVETSDGQPVTVSIYRSPETALHYVVSSGGIARQEGIGQGVFVARARADIGDRTVYVRAAIVPGEYSGPYFDGHTLGALRNGHHYWYTWGGEPDNSVSIAHRVRVGAACGLYFGNNEHMDWLPSPGGEAGDGMRGWGISGTFINGGAYARRSLTHHRVFQFGWTMHKREDLAKIVDFYGGRYGEGPFHMVMPGTHANILPKAWSMPRTTIEDGPHLVYNQPPTAVSLATAHGRPPVAAQYEIAVPGQERLELEVPVPPGFFLHFGVHGVFTGSTHIAVNGMAVTPLPNDSDDLTNVVFDQPGLYTVSLQGEGTAAIAAMTARLSQRPEDTDEHREFVPGRGTSAVEFEPDSVDITVSSAAANYYHGSATLIETGAWD